MSESVYICASSLCCCLVITAVLRIIAPGGNTSKIMSLIFGVFVLCSILTAITGLIKNTDINSEVKEYNLKEESFADNVDEQVIRTTADYISEYTNSVLESNGINNSIIRTVLGVDENNGIYLKELNIYLDSKHIEEKDAVSELIQEYVGIIPNVSESSYE